MASYLKRSFVCDRLRLKLGQSYEIVGCCYGSRISSDEVVAILNRARRGMPNAVTGIPHDLLTPDELSAELAESDITAHELLCWTRRKKAVPPHYRLTKRTIRFPRAQFMAWLDARSKVKTLHVRVA